MLDFLKDVDDFDILFFIPNIEDEENDSVRIETADYMERGEKIGGTSLGDLYHITIFRMDEDYNVNNLENFEAILIEPREYVSRMIDNDWYGMVNKKTTTSDKLTSEMLDKWSKLVIQ